eukprot:1157999-Pelagomonas_calceolata.AAC.3
MALHRRCSTIAIVITLHRHASTPQSQAVRGAAASLESDGTYLRLAYRTVELRQGKAILQS